MERLTQAGLAVVPRLALVSLVILPVAAVGGVAMVQTPAAAVLAVQALLTVGGTDSLYQAQTLF